MTLPSHFSSPKWCQVLAATGLCAVLLSSTCPASLARPVLIAQANAAEQALAEASQLNQQAFDLYQADRYAEAIPLAERALDIVEQQLGPNHLNTAQSLNNLARLYEATGRYEEAEPLYERALLIREQELGELDPDTVTTVGELARLYELAGNYEEAEALLKRKLRGTSKNILE